MGGHMSLDWINNDNVPKALLTATLGVHAETLTHCDRAQRRVAKSDLVVSQEIMVNHDTFGHQGQAPMVM